MAKTKVETNQLTHRVTMCSSEDVVVTPQGGFELRRTKAWDAWAMIVPTRGQFFSRDGYAIKENREQPSHKISIRSRRTVLISSSVWIYEARRISPPRWFKVLDQKDMHEEGILWEFTCRQVERSDAITAPADPNAVKTQDHGGYAVPLPAGVEI